MQNVRKKRKSVYQDEILINRFYGLNRGVSGPIKYSEGDIYTINMDIYAGQSEDRLESRRGTQYLRASVGSTKYASTAIAGRIVWDIGTNEYLITQVGTTMRSQRLTTTANPVDIALATGGAFALGSTTSADLFISGDKLYVLHPSANYVIRWNGSAFVAYPMGLAYPHILAVSSANAGAITGSYTVGIEKIYRDSGVDLMASTPNRKLATTRILAQTGTISAKKILVTIQAAELDNDALWTHLRFWRTKNKNTDVSDPINPIDAQGNDDELYEEALITKAEMNAVALTSIATGSTLPPGNAGAQAGKPAGVYTIEVNNADSVLFNLIGIDRIELLPIPACTTGCFNANRIFFSGVQDATLDDASKSNIWYSNYAGTKYAFQYSPLNFVDTGRNGQNMMKLIAFEKDVIGLKEASTGRLPSGDVNQPYQALDENIGIKNKTHVSFVPTLGLVAITSDFGDFKVFGYDLRWTSVLNGRDVSSAVRTTTQAITASTEISFAYINGKLLVGQATLSNFLVLHVKEGRGWGEYVLANISAGKLFTFSGGTRIALVSADSHLIEMEISGLNTDIYAATDAAIDITVWVIPRAFRHNQGRSVIEHECLSIDGKFVTGAIPVETYVNGAAWPNLAGTTTFNLVPNASIAGAYTDPLADREYRLYVEPQIVGSMKWCPMAGNYLGYWLRTIAPCSIRTIKLDCIIDEDAGWGAFDPFGLFPSTNTDPTWAQ
jgi:hypothetical protein